MSSEVHYSHNDVAALARFCYLLEEDPVLNDLHALVEFAQAGSIAGAADRLFRTPSAITVNAFSHPPSPYRR